MRTSRPTLTSGIKGMIEICVDRLTRQGRPATGETLGWLSAEEKRLVTLCLKSIDPFSYKIGDWCDIEEPPMRCMVHTRYDGEGDRPVVTPDNDGRTRCSCDTIWDWRHKGWEPA